MNRPLSPTTTAAEGMPRRRFTVAELEEMTAAGILLEDERIELIGGEVVPMSPKGNQHEVVKTALTHYWSRRLPNDLTFTTETTFRFTKDTYLEPDFVFYPAGGLSELSAGTAKLVVEIAELKSSLRYRPKGRIVCWFRHRRAMGDRRRALGNPRAHRTHDHGLPPCHRSAAGRASYADPDPGSGSDVGGTGHPLRRSPPRNMHSPSRPETSN